MRKKQSVAMTRPWCSYNNALRPEKNRHSDEKYCRILLKFIRRHHCRNETGLGNDLTPNKLLAGTSMVQLTCAYIFHQSSMS